MKKLAGIAAGTTALVAAFTGVSWADGMPAVRRAPVAAPVVVEDRCGGYGRWTGFYIGGNVGMAANLTNWRDRDGLFETPDWAVDEGFKRADRLNRDDEDHVFTGGGQVGYNYQCKNVVFGFETDINWMGTSNDENHFVQQGWWGDDQRFRHDSDGSYLGTIRARLGWTDDRLMVYATGGAAYTNQNQHWNGTDFFGVRHDFDDDVKWGWTAGGGIEYLAATNWTVKIEALWIGWESGTRDVFRNEIWDGDVKLDDSRRFRFDHEEDTYVVRVGVNYLFGGREPAPVVPLK